MWPNGFPPRRVPCRSSIDDGTWRKNGGLSRRFYLFAGISGLGADNQLALSFAYTLQVGKSIWRSAVTLRAPYSLTEAVEYRVRCRVPVTTSGENSLEFRPESRWLVNGQLLFQGKMKAQMQKRIHGAIFDREFELDCGFFRCQRFLVFRVHQNYIGSKAFHCC